MIVQPLSRCAAARFCTTMPLHTAPHTTTQIDRLTTTKSNLAKGKIAYRLHSPGGSTHLKQCVTNSTIVPAK